MDGQSRPFFYGLEATLNSQQRDALAQGIQQVVETTPADFDEFLFQFHERFAHIYCLKGKMILLVLTDGQLSQQAFRPALDELMTTLEEDLGNAIATFRLMAGCITLNNSNLKPSEEVMPPAPTASFQPGKAAGASQISPQTVLCGDVLAALNHLSDFTTQYLGKIVVANTWKSTRPDQLWLQNFEVNRSAHLQLAAATDLSQEISLTPEQHQWIKDWVKEFIGRCSKIIRDFAKIVTAQALDHRQQSLLLDESS